jgi:hypothetical protein
LPSGAGGRRPSRPPSPSPQPAAAAARLRRAPSASLKEVCASSEADPKAIAADPLISSEVIIAEQFPEAVARLACVWAGFGPTGRAEWEGQDDSSDEDEDEEDEEDEEDQEEEADEDDSAGSEGQGEAGGSFNGGASAARGHATPAPAPPPEPRRPRVLRPERPPGGGGGGSSGGAAGSGRRRPTGSRARRRECRDLISCVRIFLEREVLPHARRNRLAGSPAAGRSAAAREKLEDWGRGACNR